MKFPVDLLADVSLRELEHSGQNYMNNLLFSNPDSPQQLTIANSVQVNIDITNVGFVSLYGDKQKVLALFSPSDPLTAVALYVLGRWWTVEDLLKTADPDRDGVVEVETVGERIVLYILNRVIYRAKEKSTEERPFLCHGEHDYAKVLWKNGEAVGFYSVKPLGSSCSSFLTKRYQLPVMDSIFVRKCHRSNGLGLQMLKDFVLSFKEDNLGLGYPLTKAMFKVCEKYLSQYPEDQDLLWEVESIGRPSQRTNIANKIRAMDLSAVSRKLSFMEKSLVVSEVIENDVVMEAITTRIEEHESMECTVEIVEEVTVLKAAKVSETDEGPVATRGMSSKMGEKMTEENKSENVIRIEDIEAETPKVERVAEEQKKELQNASELEKKQQDEDIVCVAIEEKAEKQIDKEPEEEADTVPDEPTTVLATVSSQQDLEEAKAEITTAPAAEKPQVEDVGTQDLNKTSDPQIIVENLVSEIEEAQEKSEKEDTAELIVPEEVVEEYKGPEALDEVEEKTKIEVPDENTTVSETRKTGKSFVKAIKAVQSEIPKRRSQRYRQEGVKGEETTTQDGKRVMRARTIVETPTPKCKSIRRSQKVCEELEKEVDEVAEENKVSFEPTTTEVVEEEQLTIMEEKEQEEITVEDSAIKEDSVTMQEELAEEEKVIQEKRLLEDEQTTKDQLDTEKQEEVEVEDTAVEKSPTEFPDTKEIAFKTAEEKEGGVEETVELEKEQKDGEVETCVIQNKSEVSEVNEDGEEPPVVQRRALRAKVKVAKNIPKPKPTRRSNRHQPHEEEHTDKAEQVAGSSVGEKKEDEQATGKQVEEDGKVEQDEVAAKETERMEEEKVVKESTVVGEKVGTPALEEATPSTVEEMSMEKRMVEEEENTQRVAENVTVLEADKEDEAASDTSVADDMVQEVETDTVFPKPTASSVTVTPNEGQEETKTRVKPAAASEERDIASHIPKLQRATVVLVDLSKICHHLQVKEIAAVGDCLTLEKIVNEEEKMGQTAEEKVEKEVPCSIVEEQRTKPEKLVVEEEVECENVKEKAAPAMEEAETVEEEELEEGNEEIIKLVEAKSSSEAEDAPITENQRPETVEGQTVEVEKAEGDIKAVSKDTVTIQDAMEEKQSADGEGEGEEPGLEAAEEKEEEEEAATGESTEPEMEVEKGKAVAEEVATIQDAVEEKQSTERSAEGEIDEEEAQVAVTRALRSGGKTVKTTPRHKSRRRKQQEDEKKEEEPAVEKHTDEDEPAIETRVLRRGRKSAPVTPRHKFRRACQQLQEAEEEAEEESTAAKEIEVEEEEAGLESAKEKEEKKDEEMVEEKVEMEAATHKEESEEPEMEVEKGKATEGDKVEVEGIKGEKPGEEHALVTVEEEEVMAEEVMTDEVSMTVTEKEENINTPVVTETETLSAKHTTDSVMLTPNKGQQEAKAGFIPSAEEPQRDDIASQLPNIERATVVLVDLKKACHELQVEEVEETETVEESIAIENTGAEEEGEQRLEEENVKEQVLSAIVGEQNVELEKVVEEEEGVEVERVEEAAIASAEVEVVEKGKLEEEDKPEAEREAVTEVNEAKSSIEEKEAPVMGTRALRSGRKTVKTMPRHKSTRSSKQDDEKEEEAAVENSEEEESAVETRVLRQEGTSAPIKPKQDCKQLQDQEQKIGEQSTTAEKIEVEDEEAGLEAAEEKEENKVEIEQKVEEEAATQKEESIESEMEVEKASAVAEEAVTIQDAMEEKQFAETSADGELETLVGETSEKNLLPAIVDETKSLDEEEEAPVTVTRALRSGGKTIKATGRCKSRRSKQQQEDEKEEEEAAVEKSTGEEEPSVEIKILRRGRKSVPVTPRPTYRRAHKQLQEEEEGGEEESTVAKEVAASSTASFSSTSEAKKEEKDEEMVEHKFEKEAATQKEEEEVMEETVTEEVAMTVNEKEENTKTAVVATAADEMVQEEEKETDTLPTKHTIDSAMLTPSESQQEPKVGFINSAEEPQREVLVELKKSYIEKEEEVEEMATVAESVPIEKNVAEQEDERRERREEEEKVKEQAPSSVVGEQKGELEKVVEEQEGVGVERVEEATIASSEVEVVEKGKLEEEKPEAEQEAVTEVNEEKSSGEEEEAAVMGTRALRRGRKTRKAIPRRRSRRGSKQQEDEKQEDEATIENIDEEEPSLETGVLRQGRKSAPITPRRKSKHARKQLQEKEEKEEEEGLEAAEEKEEKKDKIEEKVEEKAATQIVENIEPEMEVEKAKALAGEAVTVQDAMEEKKSAEIFPSADGKLEAPVGQSAEAKVDEAKSLDEEEEAPVAKTRALRSGGKTIKATPRRKFTRRSQQKEDEEAAVEKSADKPAVETRVLRKARKSAPATPKCKSKRARKQLEKEEEQGEKESTPAEEIEAEEEEVRLETTKEKDEMEEDVEEETATQKEPEMEGEKEKAAEEGKVEEEMEEGMQEEKSEESVFVTVEDEEKVEETVTEEAALAVLKKEEGNVAAVMESDSDKVREPAVEEISSAEVEETNDSNEEEETPIIERSTRRGKRTIKATLQKSAECKSKRRCKQSYKEEEEEGGEGETLEEEVTPIAVEEIMDEETTTGNKTVEQNKATPDIKLAEEERFEGQANNGALIEQVKQDEMVAEKQEEEQEKTEEAHEEETADQEQKEHVEAEETTEGEPYAAISEEQAVVDNTLKVSKEEAPAVIIRSLRSRTKTVQGTPSQRSKRHKSQDEQDDQVEGETQQQGGGSVEDEKTQVESVERSSGEDGTEKDEIIKILSDDSPGREGDPDITPSKEQQAETEEMTPTEKEPETTAESAVEDRAKETEVEDDIVIEPADEDPATEEKETKLPGEQLAESKDEGDVEPPINEVRALRSKTKAVTDSPKTKSKNPKEDTNVEEIKPPKRRSNRQRRWVDYSENDEEEGEGGEKEAVIDSKEEEDKMESDDAKDKGEDVEAMCSENVDTEKLKETGNKEEEKLDNGMEAIETYSEKGEVLNLALDEDEEEEKKGTTQEEREDELNSSEEDEETVVTPVRVLRGRSVPSAIITPRSASTRHSTKAQGPGVPLSEDDPEKNPHSAQRKGPRKRKSTELTPIRRSKRCSRI